MMEQYTLRSRKLNITREPSELEKDIPDTEIVSIATGSTIYPAEVIVDTSEISANTTINHPSQCTTALDDISIETSSLSELRNPTIPTISLFPNMLPGIDELSQLPFGTDDIDWCNHNFISQEQRHEGKLNNLIDILKVPQHYKKNLLYMYIRNYDLVDDKCPRLKWMIYLLSQMVEKCDTALCPCSTRERLVTSYIWKDSMQLSRYQQTQNEVECTPPPIHHVTDNSKWNILTKIICTCAKATKKATIERRILRAVLHIGISRNDLDSLMK